MHKQFKLTTDGIAELEAELKELVSKRPEIAERIKLAREFGDLAENAEYSSARQEQERAESRISEVEHILKNAELISQPKKKDIVELGNTVVMKSKSGEKSFTIVGSVEADPLEGKVSDESPIGKALVGKKLGDEVEIVTPAATTKYKIEAIS
jgi:transcription elongation factor GreA